MTEPRTYVMERNVMCIMCQSATLLLSGRLYDMEGGYGDEVHKVIPNTAVYFDYRQDEAHSIRLYIILTHKQDKVTR